MVVVHSEPVKDVKLKVVVSDETGQQEERDINSTWLKRLKLGEILNAIEEAIGGIE